MENLEEGRKKLKQGDFEKAESLFVLFTKSHPKSPIGYYYLGKTYQRLEKYDKSIINYKKTISLDEDHSKSYFRMGEVYQKIDTYEEAIKMYTQCLKYDGTYNKAKRMRKNTLESYFEKYYKRCYHILKKHGVDPDKISDCPVDKLKEFIVSKFLDFYLLVQRLKKEKDYNFNPYVSFASYGNKVKGFLHNLIESNKNLLHDLADKKKNNLYFLNYLISEMKINLSERVDHKHDRKSCLKKAIKSNNCQMAVIILKTKTKYILRKREEYIKRIKKLKASKEMSRVLKATDIEQRFQNIFHPFFYSEGLLAKLNLYVEKLDTRNTTKKELDFILYTRHSLKEEYDLSELLEYSESLIKITPDLSIEFMQQKNKGNFGRVYPAKITFNSNRLYYAAKVIDSSSMEESTIKNEINILKAITKIQKNWGIYRTVNYKFAFVIKKKTMTYQFGEEKEKVQKLYYIFSELMDMNLREFIKLLKEDTLFNRTFTFSKEEKNMMIFMVLYEVARTMNFLHNINIFHRDLKPENVLIKLNDSFLEKVVLCDFGVSKKTFKTIYERFLTRQSEVFVSVANYTAPEAKPDHPLFNTYDIKKVDAYSFGMILKELKSEFMSDCFPMLDLIEKKCTDEEPSNRFDFTQIVGIIGDVLDTVLRKNFQNYKIMRLVTDYTNENSYEIVHSFFLKKKSRKKKVRKKMQNLLFVLIRKTERLSQDDSPKKVIQLIRMFDLLLKVFDFKEINQEGNTILHEIILHEREFLLNHVIKVHFGTVFLGLVNQENRLNLTPLYLSINTEVKLNVEIVLKLVENGAFFIRKKFISEIKGRDTKGITEKRKKKKILEYFEKMNISSAFEMQIRKFKELSIYVPIETVKIVKFLGNGKFGSVFLGKVDDIPFDVAIKKLPINFQLEEKQVEKLSNIINEITIMERVDSHKNILKILGISIEEKKKSGELKEYSVLIITEYCNFGDLKKYITKNSGRISFTDKIRIISDIVEGLYYLEEEKKISHRDLKPDQILLSQTEKKKFNIKICDFGFAVNNIANIKNQNRVGTREWASPEVFSRSAIGINNTLSDIYSLGLIIFFIIFEQYPFEREKNTQMIRLVHQNKVRPNLFEPGYAFLYSNRKSLKNILLKKMKKSRGKSFEVIKKIIEEIERIWGMCMKDGMEFGQELLDDSVWGDLDKEVIDLIVNRTKKKFKWMKELREKLEKVPSIIHLMKKCWDDSAELRPQNYHVIKEKITEVKTEMGIDIDPFVLKMRRIELEKIRFTRRMKKIITVEKKMSLRLIMHILQNFFQLPIHQHGDEDDSDSEEEEDTMKKMTIIKKKKLDLFTFFGYFSNDRSRKIFCIFPCVYISEYQLGNYQDPPILKEIVPVGHMASIEFNYIFCSSVSFGFLEKINPKVMWGLERVVVNNIKMLPYFKFLKKFVFSYETVINDEFIDYVNSEFKCLEYLGMRKYSEKEIKTKLSKDLNIQSRNGISHLFFAKLLPSSFLQDGANYSLRNLKIVQVVECTVSIRQISSISLLPSIKKLLLRNAIVRGDLNNVFLNKSIEIIYICDTHFDTDSLVKVKAPYKSNLHSIQFDGVQDIPKEFFFEIGKMESLKNIIVGNTNSGDVFVKTMLDNSFNCKWKNSFIGVYSNIQSDAKEGMKKKYPNFQFGFM